MAKEEKQNKTKQTYTHLKQLQNNYVSASLQCGFKVVCIRIKWALIKDSLAPPLGFGGAGGKGPGIYILKQYPQCCDGNKFQNLL